VKKFKSKLFRLLGELIVNDPDFSSSLLARYQGWSLLWREGLNQFCRWLGLPVAYSLTTLGLETSNTCNLRCQHCPVPTDMTRPRGLLAWPLFCRIIDNHPRIKRIYLTDWGEPLLHPEIVEMVAYAHSRGKHVALTTNGTLLRGEMSRRLLRSGPDLIKISIDGGPKTYEKIRHFPYQRLRENLEEFLKLREETGSETWVEVSMVIYEETMDEVEAFISQWQGKVDAINFQPRFFTLRSPRRRTCRDLWRLLVVLWDGRVTPCCADYDGQLIVGRADEQNLEEIFNGPAMRALRKQHLRKKWSGLCDQCSFYEADYHLSLKKIRELRKEGKNKKKN